MNSQPPPECISGMDVEKSFEGSDGKDLDSVDHLTSEETDLVYDSGWSAWLTLAGGWIVCFTTMGFINSFGVFVDYFGRTQAASPSAINWIGSTQNFLLTAVAALSGKLLDAGHFRGTMLSGSTIFILGIFLFSLAHPDKYYQLFLTLGVMIGLGGGIIYLPAIAVQSHHWRKHQALAIGVVGTGSSVGGIVFPLMLNKLLSQSSVGYAWSIRYTGFLCLGLLVIANGLMRARLLPTRAKEVSTTKQTSLKAIFSDIPYDLMIFGTILLDVGYLFPVFYLQLYAVVQGVDESLAFSALSIMSGTAILGRVVPNLLADRLGPFNVGVGVVLLMSSLIFLMYAVTSAATTVLFAVLYGFAFGGFFSIYAPMCISFAAHPGEIGVRMGIAYSLAAIGTLVGTPIIGALLTEKYYWSRGILFSAALGLLGTACWLAARQMITRKKVSQRV